VTDLNKYRLAVKTFELKYDELPGDMPNAQSYWPACVDVPGNPCNGNGNGNIAENSSNNEALRFWQHLSLSQIINANYLGVDGGGISEGDQYPFLLDSHMLYPWYGDKSDFLDYSEAALESQSGNWFMLDIWEFGANLNPIELSLIDIKSDDGKPYTSRFMTVNLDSSPNCLSSNNIDYALDYTGNDLIECYVLIKY
jgi:hypothetical protein